MTIYKETNSCRLCESESIDVLFSLGETAFANNYVKDVNKPELTAPLTLFICKDCCSVQLKHTVNPNLLFTDYLYESSTSPVFRNHFEDYAASVKESFNLSIGDLWIDIGSNDGVLLDPVKKLGFRELGVEPSSRLVESANKRELRTLRRYFDIDLALDIKRENGLAKIITCNNCFAHIDKLGPVLDGVRLLLADDGIFIFENAYLVDTIDNLYFDQIYHEHIYYHSIGPLVLFFEKHGMDIFRVEKNNIQGGSFRAFACLQGSREIEESVKRCGRDEARKGFYSFNKYHNFITKVNALREKTTLFLQEAKKAGKKICAFGAPAKFTTFSHVFDIDKTVIDFVIDDSPVKQGLFTPGNHIPIVPSSRLYEDKPDYCIITAWNFADSIMEKHKAYKEGGGKFVIPMPELKIV